MKCLLELFPSREDSNWFSSGGGGGISERHFKSKSGVKMQTSIKERTQDHPLYFLSHSHISNRARRCFHSSERSWHCNVLSGLKCGRGGWMIFSFYIFIMKGQDKVFPFFPISPSTGQEVTRLCVWLSQHGHHSPYIFHKSIRVWLWHLTMCRKRCGRLGTLYVRHLPMGWGVMYGHT